jgi:predicted transcriptional regulator
MTIKTIVFKIGQDMMRDVRDEIENPQKIDSNRLTVYVNHANIIPKMLTTERLRLLKKLAEDEKMGLDIQELSVRLKRKQEAVSRDVNILEQNSLITKIKKGKNVYPKLTAKEIVIRLA